MDAMFSAFFDDFTAFLRPRYGEVLKTENGLDRCFNLNMAVAEYYIRNKDAFVFSFIQVFTNPALENMTLKNTMLDELRRRGIDLTEVLAINKKNGRAGPYSLLFRLVAVTTFFWIALFHKCECHSGEQPGEEEIRSVLDSVRDRIAGGLGLAAEKVDALDYAALERYASQRVYEDTEENKLLRAVAGAVAEVGPWNASMEMVAHRSGLSKSGLYAHFKNKREMIAQLFITEFKRIIGCARMNITGTETPEEHLYLVIISIVHYLRSRPEILVAMDWLKTRRLELGSSPPVPAERPLQIYRVITEIDLEVLRGQQGPKIGQWILFMIVNTMMHSPNVDFRSVSNGSFRILYRFITLGLKGVSV
jgi:hypothetical protein